MTTQVCKTCDAVERPDRDVDYHHWTYAGERYGCFLCRACHAHIHEDGGHPRNGHGWQVTAIQRLVKLHCRDAGTVPRPQHVMDRYDIPPGAQWVVESALMHVSSSYPIETVTNRYGDSSRKDCERV